jgi:hypothetical protein
MTDRRLDHLTLQAVHQKLKKRKNR